MDNRNGKRRAVNIQETKLLRKWAEAHGYSYETARKKRMDGDPSWVKFLAENSGKNKCDNLVKNNSQPDMVEVLQRMRQTEQVVANLLQTAAKKGDVRALGNLARLHSDAAHRLLRMTQAYDDYRVQTGERVEWANVLERIRKMLGPMRSALEAMPRTLAARVNPGDPALAEDELARWVDEVRGLLDT